MKNFTLRLFTMLLVWILSLCGISIFTCCVYGPPPNGYTEEIDDTVYTEDKYIHGTVTNSSIFPMQGIEVSCYFQSDTTDSLGKYELHIENRDNYATLQYKDIDENRNGLIVLKDTTIYFDEKREYEVNISLKEKE